MNALPELIKDPKILSDTKSRLYWCKRWANYMDQIKERAQEEIDRIEDWRNQLIDNAMTRINWHHVQLKTFAKYEIEATPGKTKTAKLPGVSMSFRSCRQSVQYDNAKMKEVLKVDDARIELLDMGLATLKTTVDISKSAVLKHLANGGSLPDTIKSLIQVIEPGEDKFTVKFDDTEAFMQFLGEPDEDDSDNALLIEGVSDNAQQS